MSCKYAKPVINIISDSISATEIYCRLKMNSKEIQIKVYSKLFEIGLERSGLTDFCPVAEEENWIVCPFQKNIDN